MWRMAIYRTAAGVLTLFLVVALVFVGTALLPGDAASAILGVNTSPAGVAALRNQLHLNEPAVTQFWHFLTNIVQGNFGQSVVSQTSVTKFLQPRLVNTGVLIAFTFCVALPLGLGLGVLSALRRNTAVDSVIGSTLLVLVGVPGFATAIILALLFATSVFPILPAITVLPPGETIFGNLKDVILPGMTMVLAVTPYFCRIMRASMIEVLESDYIQMAMLKGISRNRIVWRHALPNALPAVIQVVALQVASMAGGVVLVEYVYNYPGIGTSLIDAVRERDVTVVEAITIIAAAAYVVLNVLADLATVAVTPRARARAAE